LTPRELVDSADVPGGAPLRLVRHGTDYIIVLERSELMNSRMSGSEAALGTMTCDRLATRDSPRILIGGYGMGFTLRAVLATLGARAQIVVAELVPQIISWARGPMEALTDNCLDDPRVDIVIDDVATVMTEGGYDAILLDVDNGPDGVTRPANDGLYTPHGLAKARAALKPKGILAVWSAGADAAFARRLGQAGFAVEEVRIRARANGKGPLHFLWFATRR